MVAKSRSQMLFANGCKGLQDPYGDKLRRSMPSPISSVRWTACRLI